MIKACKKCRREGDKLMLKGERCLSPKCAMIKKPYPPGVKGQSFSKMSEYGRQLREKQKAKRIYGLSEAQLRNYAIKASKLEGNSSLNLLRLIETRIDNLVYRTGFSASRSESRQMVSHGFFSIKNKRVSVPSISLKNKDELKLYKKTKKALSKSNIPEWIDFDEKNNLIKLKHLPEREEIDTTINENLIIEFYSR